MQTTKTRARISKRRSWGEPCWRDAPADARNIGFLRTHRIKVCVRAASSGPVHKDSKISGAPQMSHSRSISLEYIHLTRHAVTCTGIYIGSFRISLCHEDHLNNFIHVNQNWRLINIIIFARLSYTHTGGTTHRRLHTQAPRQRVDRRNDREIVMLALLPPESPLQRPRFLRSHWHIKYEREYMSCLISDQMSWVVWSQIRCLRRASMRARETSKR